MNTSVNWIAAYNYLFAAFNSESKTLCVGGSISCRMVQRELNRLTLNARTCSEAKEAVA